MTDSLRDQLLGLGFKPAPKPERKHDSKHGGPRHGGARPGAAKGRHPDQPPARTDAAPGKGARPHPQGRQDGRARAAGKPARSREEIDLAKAYAIRAQKEKEERIEAERLKQEQARQRREARAKLEELVKGKGLNDPEADIARHFPYGGKIKRVYVNADQLKALNAGQMGVLQLNGRYVLVDAALLAEAEAVFAPAVALKVDPDAPAEDDPYADPKYQVPDDLVW